MPRPKNKMIPPGDGPQVGGTPPSLWLLLGASAGNAYAWTEGVEVGGYLMVLPGPRQGSINNLPAYEINGIIGLPPGLWVRAWPSPAADSYLFEAPASADCCAGIRTICPVYGVGPSGPVLTGLIIYGADGVATNLSAGCAESGGLQGGGGVGLGTGGGCQTQCSQPIPQYMTVVSAAGTGQFVIFGNTNYTDPVLGLAYTYGSAINANGFSLTYDPSACQWFFSGAPGLNIGQSGTSVAAAFGVEITVTMLTATTGQVLFQAPGIVTPSGQTFQAIYTFTRASQDCCGPWTATLASSVGVGDGGSPAATITVTPNCGSQQGGGGTTPGGGGSLGITVGSLASASTGGTAATSLTKTGVVATAGTLVVCVGTVGRADGYGATFNGATMYVGLRMTDAYGKTGCTVFWLPLAAPATASVVITTNSGARNFGLEVVQLNGLVRNQIDQANGATGTNTTAPMVTSGPTGSAAEALIAFFMLDGGSTASWSLTPSWTWGMQDVIPAPGFQQTEASQVVNAQGVYSAGFVPVPFLPSYWTGIIASFR